MHLWPSLKLRNSFKSTSNKRYQRTNSNGQQSQSNQQKLLESGPEAPQSGGWFNVVCGDLAMVLSCCFCCFCCGGSCLLNGTVSDSRSKFDNKIEAASAKMYFHYYGQLLHHYISKNMLQDYVRTGTYLAAVMENRSDFSGRVVVDVGVENRSDYMVFDPPLGHVTLIEFLCVK